MRKLLAIAAALGFLGATALTPVAASSVVLVDGLAKTDNLSAQKKKASKKKAVKKGKKATKKKAPKKGKKTSSVIEYRIAA
jgi:hypothetical protein